MKPEEFIEKFGIEEAKDIISDYNDFPDWGKPKYWDSDLEIWHEFNKTDDSDVNIKHLIRFIEKRNL